MSGVWTRNYSNTLAYILAGAGGNVSPDSYTTAEYGTNKLSCRNWAGSYVLTHTYMMGFPKTAFAYGHPTNTVGSLELGIGDTAPTFEDYKLDEAVGNFTISQSQVLVNKFVWDSEAKTYSSTLRYVLQYTGSSEITIKEFGIYYGPSTGSYPILMYREVFDTPITLNQYESIVIELTQAFPIVNYEPYPT